MKINFTPKGGRFGFGFNYFCAECGRFLGNSSSDNHLEHAAVETTGWFKAKKTVPINCINAGKRAKIPKHQIDVEVTN
jgi:hypothetical protein